MKLNTQGENGGVERDAPKREHISESMSEKNGITSAMTNARIHVAATMPLHVDHATTVFECRCFDVRKRRKKMKREVTD